MEFDVVIVGAGPSGLAAAIRLKQLNADLSIVVVEKGSEVGAHILSGAVIDPVSLDKLIPDWREDADCPLKTQVKDDRFYWATASSAIRLPNFAMPPLMNNHHCYIGSLGDVCRWLGPKAEALGVEIYPGFAAAEVLYDDSGAVRGIATGDMGIGQFWEDLVSTADVVLPMVYPSHYHGGVYNVRHPNSEPYHVVKRALEDGLRRSTPLGKTAEIRPYLQAFTLGPPRYSPTEVRAQIRAAQEVGIESWVLWNPRSAYDPGIFRPKSSTLSSAGASQPGAGN